MLKGGYKALGCGPRVRKLLQCLCDAENVDDLKSRPEDLIIAHACVHARVHTCMTKISQPTETVSVAESIGKR